MALFGPRLPDQSDEDLVRRLARGQSVAFDELYRRYHDRLLHYFRRMLGRDHEKARDFLQDLFLKLIERPERFSPDGCFRTWVFAVAHNMCCNEYRRAAVRRDAPVQPQPAPTSPPPGEGLEQREFRRALEGQLLRLDQIKRSTFLLRYQEELSLQQIAQVMGCAVGTVKSRLFYAAKELANELDEYRPASTAPAPTAQIPPPETERPQHTQRVYCNG